MKSYLKSKTMMGAAVTVVGAVGALITSPVFHTQAAECLGIFGQSSLAQTLMTLSPIFALGGGALSAYGRLNAKTQIYTPKGFPGNDKPQQEPPTTW